MSVDWSSGYYWSVALFAATIAQALMIHHNWGLGVRNGTHIRMALMGACFQKMQRLSPRARLKYSVGELTNIVSVDAARVADSYLCACVHWFGWSAIVVMLVSLFELFQLIGWSSILGATMLAVVGPLSKRVTKRIKAASSEVQTCRDVSRHDIAAIWVAFFSRRQRYRR